MLLRTSAQDKLISAYGVEIANCKRRDRGQIYRSGAFLAGRTPLQLPEKPVILPEKPVNEITMIPALEAIFGNPTAAGVLLFIQNYDSGYASRIAQTYDMPVSVVQDQLRKLEAAGVLVSRNVGRTRVFEFNPRSPTAKRLRDFLSAELAALPVKIRQDYFLQRRRPRKSGKPLRRARE